MLRDYSREDLLECVLALRDTDNDLLTVKKANMKRMALLEELKAEQYETSLCYIENKQIEEEHLKQMNECGII